jgi:thioredoxin-dependent peroxiredoxin
MSELKAGDPAPDFETVDETGEKVSLKDLRGKRVVLYFYPKDNTTGCTAQACAFRDSFPQIEARNAVVMGISPDSARSHQGFKSRHDLPFPLLLDPDHEVALAYDVWREKSMYGRKYMGMLRSHFVIDEQGKIVDAQYNVKASDSAPRALESLA